MDHKKRRLLFSKNSCLICHYGAFNFAFLLQSAREQSLMISMLYEATLFEISDARPAPWSALSWGVFVPVALVGNVALAIVAWCAVEFTMKLF
jgi:hypothetical protein